MIIFIALLQIYVWESFAEMKPYKGAACLPPPIKHVVCMKSKDLWPQTRIFYLDAERDGRDYFGGLLREYLASRYRALQLPSLMKWYRQVLNRF